MDGKIKAGQAELQRRISRRSLRCSTFSLVRPSPSLSVCFLFPHITCLYIHENRMQTSGIKCVYVCY